MTIETHTTEAVPTPSVTFVAQMDGRGRALDALAQALGRDALSPCTDAIRDALESRERLASTHVGDGVAIPHARVPDLGATRMAVVVVREGVDFDDDGQRVHILAGLLGDAAAPRAHLQALQRVARALSDPAVRLEIIAADDPQAVLRALALRDDGGVHRAA